MDILFGAFGALCGIVGAAASYYFYIRLKIVEAANDAINIAESTQAVKEEKMKIAVNAIREVLPSAVSSLISDKMITGIIQKAFDAIEEYAHKQTK